MNTVILRTRDELLKAQEVLVNSPRIAWDTETTGLKFYKHKIFAHSFSNQDVNYALRNEDFGEQDIQNLLRAVLTDPNKLVINQNLKFDKHMLRASHGIELNCKQRDTLIMSHLMDENTSTRLKDRCEKVLGFAPDEKDAVEDWLTDKFGKDKANWDFSAVPRAIMDPYSGKDPWLALKLDEHYWPHIQQHFPTLFETEMKVSEILYKMEKNGMPVDVAYLKNLEAVLEGRIFMNLEKIYAAFGAEFDVDSPMELAEVLYDKMRLPIPSKARKGTETKDGKVRQINSTDDAALEEIDHPIAVLLQTHRSISKTLNTYVKPYQEMAVNGVLYPDYRLTGTRSGRFSAGEPNTQAISKDLELRQGFPCEAGEEMYFWDQTQIEMIGFGMYSKDPIMLQALKEGQDLHHRTAMEVLTKEEINSEERAMGKGTNFAIVFGVGKARLGSYLTGYVGRKVSDTEAAGFKSRYINKFPMVYAFQQQVMKTVKTYRQPWGHFVKNKFGRVCRLSPDKAYIGVNRLVQSWAADMMKASMVRVEETFRPKWRQQIHDAFRLDFQIGEGAKVAQEISRLITDWPDVGLPIKCTIERSQTNWAELEKLDAR